MRGSSNGAEGSLGGGGRRAWGQETFCTPCFQKPWKCPCGLRVSGQASFSDPDARSDAGAFPSLPPAASSGKFLQRGPSLPQFESHLNLNGYPYPAPSHTHTLSQAQKPPLVWPQQPDWFSFFFFFFFIQVSLLLGASLVVTRGVAESDRTERLNWTGDSDSK